MVCFFSSGGLVGASGYHGRRRIATAADWELGASPDWAIVPGVHINTAPATKDRTASVFFTNFFFVLVKRIDGQGAPLLQYGPHP
jgi:hypothetical protein